MITTLQTLVDIKGGGTPNKKVTEYWNGDIPWVSVKNFKNGELSITSDYITQRGVDESATNVIPKGSIIVPTRMALGKVVINTVDVAINQDLKALLIKDEKCLDKDYLFYCLQSKAADIQKKGKGATVKGITLDVLKSIKIPLPPLKTQKYIATILEKADLLRKDCQQVEQALNQLAQSVFIEMFGDPVTNPMGWESAKLKSLVTVLSGATPSKQKPEYWNGDYPWVSPKDMKRDELEDSIDHINSIVFEETNLKKIAIGSVLIVVRGMILIHTVPLALTKKSLSINQDIKALTVKSNKINNEVLLWILKVMHGKLLSIVSTAAHGTKRIDMRELLSVEIIVPDIEQQNKFLESLEIIKLLKRDVLLQKKHEQNLFNALSQKAFKGELKIPA